MANIETYSKKDFFNSPLVQKQFDDVLKGAGKQFTTSILSVVQANSTLKNATNESIMTAAMKAAVLNLPVEPSLGFAYIVAYGRQAQFQIGYKGLIQLAIRSGQVKGINAGVVRESQFKSYDPLFEELEVDFSQKPEGKVAGYFATLSLINGFKKLVYWTYDEVYAHGKRFSKSFNSGPWKTDFDAMAKKTLLKEIIGKYAPLSTELQEAIVADNEDLDYNRSIKEAKIVNDTAETIGDILGRPAISTEAAEAEPSEQKEAEAGHTPPTYEETVAMTEGYPAEDIPDFTEEPLEEISFF